MGVRTAGKGYKATSVSNSDSDDGINKQYDMEAQSFMNSYSPATPPVQGFKRRMPDSEAGDSALPKRAKSFKHQSNEKKGTANNNNNRSRTKSKTGTNLGGLRWEHNLAFVENIAAAAAGAKADSKLQATRSNGIWPNESYINQAKGSNKRRRGAEDDTDYNPDGEHYQLGRSSRKPKIRKSS